ncbi:uncharacterized protein [Chanodichthys erythropterus]|uniref:uncharacterized protein n=1 Tax=Chanodichthys erythropterus TaxID=933992 RepID=UPI00351F5D50
MSSPPSLRNLHRTGLLPQQLPAPAHQGPKVMLVGRMTFCWWKHPPLKDKQGMQEVEKKSLEKEAHPDPPQKPHTNTTAPPSAAPVSAPDGEHGRASDVTDADKTAACVASANVTGAALQPCLGTATAADTAHPERSVGVWRYSLRCPKSDCPARSNQNAILYRCGYSHTVRQICRISGWYSMLTEVLACNACIKAAKESEEYATGRFPSWDACIIDQLSPAYRAVLTLWCGVLWTSR